MPSLPFFPLLCLFSSFFSLPFHFLLMSLLLPLSSFLFFFLFLLVLLFLLFFLLQMLKAFLTGKYPMLDFELQKMIEKESQLGEKVEI